MTTTLPPLDITALAHVSGAAGSISNRYVNGFKKGFDSASWCPPANTNAGWNCRLAAGRGGGMAATDNGRWIR